MTFGLSGRFADPSAMVTHFHLREGDAVGDFGAGTGNFMKYLSTAVGGAGKVYAFEIQKGLVDKIGIRAREERLMNVQPMWCDLEAEGGTKLADGILNIGILTNTLFQLEQKETALKEIARVMRKGAKLFVTDWTDSFGGMGPKPQDVVRESDARMLVERAGFSFERTYPAGDHHYGLAFRKL